jgi:GMP synthase (glutamine-hydrolysing)
MSQRLDPKSKPRQVLAIMHQDHSTPGKVGESLVNRGYEIDCRRPMLGEPLPQDLSDYAAAVIFGGPQSANDDHLPGIRAELDWIEANALPSRLPLLGICLGAQEIARVLGAPVSKHDEGQVEIGYVEVHPTDAADGFLGQTTMFYQWHSETFGVPDGAVHLAHNKTFAGQAFRYQDRVYAIEFHPEMTRAMIDKWCTSETGRPKLQLPGAQPHSVQLRDYDQFARDSDRWLESFLDGFIELHSR